MPLQKPLRGFSSFIGLFRGGNFRMEPEPTLQPVIEMEDFLSPNPFTVGRGTFTNLGDDIQITIPEGKFWRLKWMAVAMAPGVAQHVSVSPFIRKIFGGTTFIFPLSPRQKTASPNFNTFDTNAGEFTGYAVPLEKFNAQAGDEIGIKLTARNQAGAFDADFYVQYQEIDV